jgi:hypothetical protein
MMKREKIRDSDSQIKINKNLTLPESCQYAATI